jgi:hypothetical protein
LEWDYPLAREHRQVVKYPEGPIDQTEIQFVFRDNASLGNLIDQPSSLMEILGHERGINFPIGSTLALPSLQDYRYQ